LVLFIAETISHFYTYLVAFGVEQSKI